MGKMVDCTTISVDCVVNDPVDVRCGGPDYLGFDFYVRTPETEEMIKFITEAINRFGIPLAAIYDNGYIDLDESDVWTKKRILESINNEAEYLKEQAARNYGQGRKK